MEIYGFTLPDIIGIGLSIISIIVASAIPKAIKKYRVQEAMSEINIVSIKKLKDFRDKLELDEEVNCNLKYIEFVYNIGEIITWYSSKSKYFPIEYNVKIKFYNFKYKIFIFKKDLFKKIPASMYSELIEWLDKYCQAIEDINLVSEKPPKYITTINKAKGEKDDGECK